jgi:hypothetical protein
MSRADQQTAYALLPDTHQSRTARNYAGSRTGGSFLCFFSQLLKSRTVTIAPGTALATQVIEQMLKLQSNSTSFLFWRTAMLIENLSKELDTRTMTAVRGGDNGNSATNAVGQAMGLSAPVTVGPTGPANTNVHVNGTQNGTIWNDQYAGDSFLALFPSPCEVIR